MGNNESNVKENKENTNSNNNYRSNSLNKEKEAHKEL